LKTPKVFQPPFVHWSFEIGSGGASVIVMSPLRKGPAPTFENPGGGPVPGAGHIVGPGPGMMKPA
jgi:hypothetical protein